MEENNKNRYEDISELPLVNAAEIYQFLKQNFE